MLRAFTRSRYQVSVYRTIGPLACLFVPIATEGVTTAWLPQKPVRKL